MTVFGRDINQPSTANTIFGMIIVAFSTGLFCAVGAIAQYNGGSLIQLMFASYAIQFFIALSWWCIRKPSQATNWYGDAPYKCNIWTRGILYWVMMFTWWKGLEMVPIGDAEGIIFLAPILTIFLARILLKEELPRTYALILALTAIGLIFICQPEFIFSNYMSSTQVSWVGMIFLMVCVASWSSTSLLVRTAKEAHWLQVNIVNSFLAAWVLTPTLGIINHFVGNNLGEGNGTPASNLDYSNVTWIDGADFSDWDWSPGTMLAIVAMAFFEFFAVTCKVVGYQLGEATKVASMEYMDIVFAYAFQYFMFHRTPNTWEMVGGGLLILACAIQFSEEKFFPRHPVETDGTSETGEEARGLLLQELDVDGKKRKSLYGTVAMHRANKLHLDESMHFHINFDGDEKVEQSSFLPVL